MSDNQTTATKKGGFIRRPGIAPVADVQASGGCCGQPSNTLIQIAGDQLQAKSPAAVGGCCGETVSSDAGSTGCCGEPAEKQGCCG